MNLTKYAVIGLLTIGCAFGLQTSTRAADTNAPTDSLATERLTAWHERMEKEAKELGLSEEQKEKIKVILHKYLGGVHGIHQNAELSAEEKMAKIKTIKEEISAEFKKVMTPEQFAKWKAREGQTLPQAQVGLERLHSLIDALNLSDDQKEKLRDMHEENMEKLQKLRDNASLTLSEKLEKLSAMRKEVEPKLKEVFDEDQYKKWEAGMDKWFADLKARVKQEKPE